MQKSKVAAPAIGQKAKKAGAAKATNVEAAVTKPKVDAVKATKPAKPAKKAFAKLPEAPVSMPEPKAPSKPIVKADIKPVKKSAASSGEKFTPPAISLAKIRKAASTAASSEKPKTAEPPVVAAKVSEERTMLPEAMVNKKPAPKKVEKPAPSSSGKKSLEELLEARNKVLTNRRVTGFNPLDHMK